MEADRVDAYLARIGADRRTPLAELQRLHLAHVPFENLSIHLGEPIDLDEGALHEKVVVRRRGGFCFELNGLFAALLEALGADVARVPAQVYGSDGALGPPLDHMQLLVTWPGSPDRFLVDVGFGRFTTYPLRWDVRRDQPDPAGAFRLVDDPAGYVDVFVDGTPQCRTDVRPLRLPDFEPMSWWHQTSPESHFTRAPACSRLDGDGRVTLAGNVLIRTSTTGERREEALADDSAVLAAYREHFGIVLELLPRAKYPEAPQTSVPGPA